MNGPGLTRPDYTAEKGKQIVRSILFAMCLFSMTPVATADDEVNQIPMDCGALWVDGAEARLRVVLSPDLYNPPSRQANLTIQDNAFGEPDEPLRSATVFRCVPNTLNGSLEAVPSSWHRSREGTHEIRFELPESAQSFEEFRYHLYLSKEDRWEEQRSTPADINKPWRPNLTANPNFSGVNPADPSNPEGWYLEGERKQGNYRISSELLLNAGEHGENGVRLQVVGPSKNTSEVPAPRVSLAEKVTVTPSSILKVKVRAWIRSATGVGLRVEGRFRDQNGNSVGSPLLLESPFGSSSEGYKTYEAWGRVPTKAKTMQVRTSMMNNVGVTDLSGIRIEESLLDRKPFATILQQKLEEGSRTTKPMQTISAGDSNILDLGPENSRNTAGFQPLFPNVKWSPDVIAGWSTDDHPDAFEGELPDALSEDGIILGSHPLKIRTQPGSKWLWVLVGSSGEHNPGTFGSNDLRVNGKPVAVPPIPYAPIRFQMEREDDAIQELRTQNKSIFNSYVLPRFTQLIMNIESDDDFIEVSCAPEKNCPVVAMGVFSNTTEDRVNQAILRIHGKRRQAFEDRWATSEAPKRVSKNIEVSEGEKERGFLPFIPTPGIPLLPHSTPDRKSVRKAMNGLRISVAPGSRALFRVGIYPLKFRRQGQLSFSEPISQVGDRIEGADWKLRTTRYRALREEGQDGSYILAPDIAEETRTLGIRPGITRTIWVDADIPETAKPGDYAGALRIQAGKSRFIELPIRIHVLPFPLPVPGHGHGTSLQKNTAIDYRILRYVNAISLSLQTSGPDQLIADMEQTIGQLQRSGNFAETIFLVPEVSFESEKIEDWLSILTVLSETAKSRNWPQFIPVSSAFKSAGFSPEHVKRLCNKMDWTCASVTQSNRPRRRDQTEQIKWLTSDAYQDHVLASQQTDDYRGLDSSWLYNLGCGRYGKGLLSWAYNLHGTLCINGHSGLKDPLDAWSMNLNSGTLDHLNNEGQIIETERFLLSQQGLLDARYLALLEQLLERGKKVLPKEQLSSMRDFLRNHRSAVITAPPGEWRFGISRQWPVSHQFREEVISLLNKAWNSLKKQ